MDLPRDSGIGSANKSYTWHQNPGKVPTAKSFSSLNQLCREFTLKEAYLIFGQTSVKVLISECNTSVLFLLKKIGSMKLFILSLL